MAGIGFEFNKLLERDTALSKARAYGYSALISSGAWVLSILGILRIGFYVAPSLSSSFEISQFQVSITYLIGFSLILSGIFQQSFCRFVADRIYERKEDVISNNLNGCIFLLTLISGSIGVVLLSLFFSEQPLAYKFLMLGGFVLLCNIWVLSCLLSSLKEYDALVLLFFIAYMSIFCVAVLLQGLGFCGLLAGFVIGQAVLFFGLLCAINRHYPLVSAISFDFIKKGQLYVTLIFIGLFYNAGVWVDKIIFWFSPLTSHMVIGPLRASEIYDLPIFIAYLGIVPGMAYFLLKMETEFSLHYKAYYNAISFGGTLTTIREKHQAMVDAAREGIQTIIKIQTAVVLLFFIAGSEILQFLGISKFYVHLLVIDSISVSLQMLLLALLNILFYLDKRKLALFLCVTLTVANILLSYLSIQLGPFYFGYGFAFALLITVVIGMKALDQVFKKLTFKTFMTQPI